MMMILHILPLGLRLAVMETAGRLGMEGAQALCVGRGHLEMLERPRLLEAAVVVVERGLLVEHRGPLLVVVLITLLPAPYSLGREIPDRFKYQ